MINITTLMLLEADFPDHVKEAIRENKSVQMYSTNDGYAWVDFKEMGANGYRRFKGKLAMFCDIVSYYD